MKLLKDLLNRDYVDEVRLWRDSDAPNKERICCTIDISVGGVPMSSVVRHGVTMEQAVKRAAEGAQELEEL